MATVNFVTEITTFALLIVNLFLALMVRNFDAFLTNGYRPPPGYPAPQRSRQEAWNQFRHKA